MSVTDTWTEAFELDLYTGLLLTVVTMSHLNSKEFSIPWAQIGVIARSGVLTSGSSGDQVDVSYLNTVFELYSSYHLSQIIEAA